MFKLFEKINRTHLSLGSEALYRQLRLFNFDGDKQAKLEELVEFYQDNPKIRQKIEYMFLKLGKEDHNFVVRFLTESKKKKNIFLALY